MVKVVINPTPEQRGSGLTAQVSWDNDELMAALKKVVNLKERSEKIVAIEVDEFGIKLRLQYLT